MARSGSLKVLEFNCAANAGRILVASTGIDIDDSAADAATIAVPVDLIIYQFGVYVMETLGTSASGDIVLETVDAGVLPTSGTATARATIDLESTNLARGNGAAAGAVALVTSDNVVAGSVVFAPTSTFPLLIRAPLILHVSHVDSGSSEAGELAPFIVCRWLTPDLRSSEQWGSTA